MKKNILFLLVVGTMFLSSCSELSDTALKPLVGLEWYTEYDTVKQNMKRYTLLEERESGNENVKLFMQDYENVELFDYNCDLTLCFKDSGLIGFNYHDIERNQNYSEWYSTLESTYGLPTEEGSGMASWYDNPAGKNTAIYLFNLEEGVQVSIYATADSPDKSYDKEIAVPTPEIRTPIVPVSEESVTNTENLITDEKGEQIVTADRVSRADDLETIGTDAVGYYTVAVTDAAGEVVTDKAGETVTTVIQATAVDTDVYYKSVSAATEVTKAELKGKTASDTALNTESKKEKSTETVTESPADRTYSFLLNGLSFYGSPTSQRQKMDNYTQLYEYRTDETDKPWEIIMEYKNVPYEGKKCDMALCFTSLGLVGVNYFDNNTSNYDYWIRTLRDIYGAPDETQQDYSAWSSNPVGIDTMIYVFALDDGVQISFFADDTGAEFS